MRKVDILVPFYLSGRVLLGEKARDSLVSKSFGNAVAGIYCDAPDDIVAFYIIAKEAYPCRFFLRSAAYQYLVDNILDI